MGPTIIGQIDHMLMQFQRVGGDCGIAVLVVIIELNTHKWQSLNPSVPKFEGRNPLAI